MGRKKNVGKGEIALYEQFLLFPQFSKHVDTKKKQGLFGKELNNEYLTKKMSCREKQCQYILVLCLPIFKIMSS